MKCRHHIASLALGCTALAAVLTACSVIDDDLSQCESSFQLDYELRLVTNMTTELQTQLTTQTDVQLASRLHTHLQNIFTDFAHDVDLSFYDIDGDSVRLHHDQHVMDANQASYTLYLPVRRYVHTAVANIAGTPQVELSNDNYCHTAHLATTRTSTARDTIDSHTTGIFTARLPMDVLEGVNQSFSVHLYMANCATALVVDTTDSGISDLRVLATGFATGFRLADSTYIYGESPMVRTSEVHADDDNRRQCFLSVSFPSRDTRPDTRLVIETEEPFMADSSDDSLWELRAYATATDGSTTESRLYVKEPLRAGQLKIIKARLHNDGTLTTDDVNVGVSVALNWNSGGIYTPEL